MALEQPANAVRAVYPPGRMQETHRCTLNQLCDGRVERDSLTGILAELGIGRLKENLDPVKRCYCRFRLDVNILNDMMERHGALGKWTYHAASNTARKTAA